MEHLDSQSEAGDEYMTETYEIIQYEEVDEPAENSLNNLANSQVDTLKTPKLEKPQLYAYYVKEEPRNEEEISNLRSYYNHSEENVSHEEASSSIMQETGTVGSETNNSETIIPETIVPETIVPETIVSENLGPEMETPDPNVSLEPRKRGRPKKKPISVLTPMEISNNHDSRASGETLENHSEHLYAGFLGRTRRTTRQIQEEENEREWSADSDNDFDYLEPRGRPYGSVKNRGRGRGRARGRGVASRRGRRSKVTENKDLIGQIEEMEIASTEPIEATERVLPTVKCGKCQEEFLKRDWSRHNLLKHNDTGWLDGQTPVDYNSDEKSLKKILMVAIKKRKGQLTCEQCGIVKKSAVGFMSHIRFCGKTDSEKMDLMVQCSKCHSSVKPTSLYTHEKNCQREKSNLSIDGMINHEEIDQLNASQGKSKRKAAEKAVSRISEFTSATSSAVEKITPNTINNFIQKPRLKRKINKCLKEAFNAELEQTGVSRCRQANCDFYGTSLDIICEHTSRCSFQVQENYICKVCNMHLKIYKEMKDHVLEKHSTEDNSDSVMDPDHQMKNEESSDTSEGEEEPPKGKPVNLRFFPDKVEEKLRAFRAVFLDKELIQNPKTNVPYIPPYRWTLEFELNNYQFNLFKDLLPNEFKLLSKEEAEPFLPELQQSMAIKRPRCEESIFSDSGTTGNEWNYWQRFEGRVEEGVPSFFVGGPVWAIAWLPIPFLLRSQNANQFLAISTHPKMESEYLVGQAYSGKNVIQIWNLGNIQQRHNELLDPELSYAVAHNGGTIWCMEWCPSGSYHSERVTDFDKNFTKVERMGLLATACSDGFVHIYSLPFPEELQAPDIERNQLPVYKVNPVLLLVVNISLTEKEKQTWQCTKLSWTKEKGHSILAAGFSNGYIALWNLTTQSSLLKKKQGNTTLINSFRHFFAHHHSISMISMIPYGEKRFLVSAGIDRCYKVWDLEQQNCVESVTTRGLALDGSWMNNWLCSVLGYDDALGLSHTNSQLIPLREHSYKYFPVLATNSPTYGIGVSDHANAIAEGTLAGEIVAIFPNQLLYKDIENYLNKKRWLCSYVEVTDFKSPENPVEDQNRKDKKEYHYKPTTYAECSERFGISFSEDFQTFRTCKAKQLHNKIMPTDQLETVSIEQYPFASVNRISWNPNAWSYLWFAAGYQNGFVRLLNFNYVSKSDNVEKILPRFIAKLRERERRADDNTMPEPKQTQETQEIEQELEIR